MLDELRQRFPVPGVDFRQRDRLVLVDVCNDHGSLTLTPFGATVLSYAPRGGAEVLWVSDTARYDGVNPIRGGIPVCWPWFGPYDPAVMGAPPVEAAMPAHGVARDALWSLEGIAADADGTRVTLCLEPDAAIRRVWPRNFVLRLTVHLGERLTLSLSGENHSDTEWHVSEALHAYFAVADAAVTRVTGLAGTTCVDKLAGNARDVQGQALAVVPPMDRVYLGHDGPVVVEDAAGGRRIVVDRTGGLSTIVWNPGAEGARALADMPDGAYTSMVCVEAGNALDDGYRLAPGQQHELRMSIAVE